MSTTDLAALASVLLALLMAGALAGSMVWLLVTVRGLRTAIERATVELESALEELHDALGVAGEQLERNEAVLDTLDSVSQRVDATSNLAYDALSRPVIRAVSIGSGTARAARRLRKRPVEDPWHAG